MFLLTSVPENCSFLQTNKSFPESLNVSAEKIAETLDKLSKLSWIILCAKVMTFHSDSEFTFE